MQKEDGNKNLLRSNTRNQRQQIEPRREIENRGVRDKIYCKNAIENGGHLSLLSNHSALLNSIVTPEPRRRRINHQHSTFLAGHPHSRRPRGTALRGHSSLFCADNRRSAAASISLKRGSS